MRIGIDFDNTIANYDGVFYAAALDRGLIPRDLGRTKSAVRDYLNAGGNAEAFTELQGYIYGARMDLPSPYPGFLEVMAHCAARGDDISIVSHKTRHPLLGPRYDMHEAARGFLAAHRISEIAKIAPDRIFFEPTKQAKVKRAAALDLDLFIDDLPEIFAMADFPPGCRGILFAPEGVRNPPSDDVEVFSDWRAIGEALRRRP